MWWNGPLRLKAYLEGMNGAVAISVCFWKNGKIGVIGHGCYNEFDGTINQLVYTNIAFVFDPETFQVSDLKMIGTRKSYPTGEGKKPNLADCAFTSGIVKRDDGRYDLYSGVGDTAEGRVIIENPFPAKIKE